MADRREAYRLAWRVIRYRHHHLECERHPPEAYIARLADLIEQCLDHQLLDALPRGAADSAWDSWQDRPR